jgi:integrase
MRIRMKYLEAFVSKGRTYAFFRRGGKRVPLPVIGTPDFMAAYQACLRGEEPAIAITTARSSQGSISTAVAQYLDSKSFEKRVPSEDARKRQASTLRNFCKLDGVGTSSLALLDRKYIDRVIEDAPTVSIARTWLITVRPFLQWAVKQGMIETDATAGIVIKLPKSDGHATITEQQIAQFEKRWPIGTRERLLFALLIYTGQRVSDVLKLGHHSIQDGVFPIKQQKTGVEIFVPVHPELAAAIAACSVVGTSTFLTAVRGGKLDQRYLNKWFVNACVAAGLPTSRDPNVAKKDRCVPHGLRKSFCRRLADLGVPPHHIAALSGHLTLKEVTRYTAAYDRRQAAKAGMAALVAGRAA